MQNCLQCWTKANSTALKAWLLESEYAHTALNITSDTVLKTLDRAVSYERREMFEGEEHLSRGLNIIGKSQLAYLIQRNGCVLISHS